MSADDDVTAESLQRELVALLRAWQDRGLAISEGVATMLGFSQRMMSRSGLTCAELGAAMQRCFREQGMESSLLMPEEVAFLRDDGAGADAEWLDTRRAVLARLEGDPDAYEDSESRPQS